LQIKQKAASSAKADNIYTSSRTTLRMLQTAVSESSETV
jgi:hypothetical protein